MFHIAEPQDIKRGKVTDVYFDRTVKILKEKNLDKRVVVEVRAHSLPSGYRWAVLSGIDEALYLLEDLEVKVESMPEGTIFHAFEPVLTIEGNYGELARYETPLLGLLCQASGVATRAARCKKASGGKPIYHFGARRMHPAVAPMIDRASFIGGCDGVAVGKSARMLNEEPVGTIPHALVLLSGDTVKAMRFFHEVIDPKVKRVALIDTLGDEKFEALRVAEDLGDDLFAVRLDTPPSRRGDFLELLKEVRWELDLRGFKKVKLFVSGGMDEEKICLLSPIADAFGVGTWISNAPVVDFSLDIVEVEGRPLAKRGKLSGKKQVWRCSSCFSTQILPANGNPGKCSCGGDFVRLLEPVIERGKLIKSLPSPQEIRKYVLEQLEKVQI